MITRSLQYCGFRYTPCIFYYPVNFLLFQVILENLTEDATYWLKLRGFARSSIDNSSVFPGEWSEARQLVMRGGCQIAQVKSKLPEILTLFWVLGSSAGLGYRRCNPAGLGTKIIGIYPKNMWCFLCSNRYFEGKHQIKFLLYDVL